MVKPKPLVATWQEAAALALPQKKAMLEAPQETVTLIMEGSQYYLASANDLETAGDYEFEHLAKQAQLAMIRAYWVFSTDLPAGTGSLANKSLSKASVSYTMAYNNAPFKEWLIGNIYGKELFALRSQIIGSQSGHVI